MGKFLTDTEIASLVEAIQMAERFTTGEIRVHIDSNTECNNANVAFEVFKTLCMHKTAERNGVLFHINFEKKYLTIIGDEGIHQKVHQEFWDHLHDTLTAEFAKGNYFNALKDAILKTGKELKQFFPTNDNPVNELSDEITFS
ncbi:TPM domain-containing protein [Bergeyella porcorum]|uniref:TPM domain-containing protein n=1 Tax=Bergeyella porcorum TaxID=1735111 RepID=UPI0035F05CE3